MRAIIGSMIISTAFAAGFAQEAAPAAKQELATKMLAELTAASPKHAIKDSPFSCDEINESVQTLSDGNRIVRSSKGRYYRNSEGRIRREMTNSVGGFLGTTFTIGEGVSILNPLLGQHYLLDSKLRTARVIELPTGPRLSVAAPRPSGEDERMRVTEKIRSELAAAAKAQSVIVSSGGLATTVARGQGGFSYSIGGQDPKFETRTEELGSRDVEGVSAEGTRRITTIPAGAIGNERPIEIVYERWFSKELGLVVYSRNSDPRFGDQTYRLTNIERTEPDPALFTVPQGYRTITDITPKYRVAPAKPEAVRVAQPIQVRQTKP